MSIVVECGCGKKVRVGDSMAGRAMKCPACNSPLSVPLPGLGAVVDTTEEEEGPAAPATAPRVSLFRRWSASRRHLPPPPPPTLEQNVARLVADLAEVRGQMGCLIALGVVLLILLWIGGNQTFRIRVER